jgi:aminoglycoside phosphotransferase (APT) family kinase protein
MTLDDIPADRRQAARAALEDAFGGAPAEVLQPVTGGASGAAAYRVRAEGRDFLLRLADPAIEALRNPHQYACLQAASEAGIAPRLRHADPARGVAIMDFVAQQPLSAFPGGPAALAAAAGTLLARLQGGPPFPELFSYPGMIGRGLERLTSSGRLAAGLLDRHLEAFARIRDAYPWDEAGRVASHNDPNPRNLLFDGERLWLVDWETAGLNDPMVDVAIVTLELAAAPELQEALLAAWLGRAPDARARARLVLMRPLARLYYAVLLLGMTPAPETPETDLAAPAPGALQAAVASGRLAMGSPEMLRALGKTVLAGALEEARTPAVAAALERLGR